MHPHESAGVHRTSPHHYLDDDTLLTAAQTRARFGGVSAMCIWRWMHNPALQFPKPVKIGASRRNYWRLGDLRRWQAEHAQKIAA